MQCSCWPSASTKFALAPQALKQAYSIISLVDGRNDRTLNQNRRQVLELLLDGNVRVVRVEPLAAAKAVAATSFLGISSGATARPASFSAQIELALLSRITKLKIYVSLVDRGNHRDIFL